MLILKREMAGGEGGAVSSGDSPAVRVQHCIEAVLGYNHCPSQANSFRVLGDRLLQGFGPSDLAARNRMNASFSPPR